MENHSVSSSQSARAGWWLSLYPEAAEGGGCFIYRSRRRPFVVAGTAANPERARQEAARRARARLRRYCAANRLNRLGTLTYGPPFCRDPRQARGDIAVFFRLLRESTGGKPLPYVWVPEFHKDGERLHLHFAVNRYLKRSLIERSWGHGFVNIKLIGDLPVGSGTLEEARRAAGYLSKYVGKAFDEPGLARLHRFDVAQGFQPAKVRVYGRTEREMLDVAAERMGAEPSRLWRSADVSDWQGPPAVWASWGR